MVEKTLVLTRGDTRPVLEIDLYYDDVAKTPFTLQASDVVRLRLGPRGGGAPVLVKAATIVSPPSNKIQVTFSGDDLDLPAGLYAAAPEVDVGGGGTQIQTAAVPFEVEIQDPPVANLLTNPSFESDLTGWTTANLGGGEGTIAASTERAFVGSKSCKFTIPTQGSDNWAQVRQDIAVAATVRGDSVVLQARVLATALPDAGAGYLVRLEESRDGGAMFTLLAEGTETTTMFEWVRLTVTGTLSAAATHVRAMILSRRGATMYVDAVQLEAGARATPYRDP